MTIRDLCQLKGTNPHTILHGKEGDMSNLCQFNWNGWVYYRANDANAEFPLPSWTLGRVLGLAKGTGNEMFQ